LIGKVDDRNWALVEIEVRKTPSSPAASLTAWIDTAFDGHLVFPRSLIERLELESLVGTEAILADGRKITLETFICDLTWFGTVIPLQVIASEATLPLLGTGLLDKHVLHIDYLNKRLDLD
jgi:clan AA aspartic protease